MREVAPPWAGRYRRLVETTIGILPHTGWAWLVRVSGMGSAPRVEARARVVACDVLAGQLYHLAAGRKGDQAEFFEERRAWAVAETSRALGPHLGDVRAAAVLGKEVPLPPLPRIVASHPLIHGAEGELWRAIFAEVCRERGLLVTRALGEDVRAALVARHGCQAVEAFLAQGRRDLGAPWGREVQEAALGAWSAR